MNNRTLHSNPFDYNHLVDSHLDELKKSGAYRNFINIEKNQKTFPEFQFTNAEGNIKTAINWCTNDYLAMSTNHLLIEAVKKSVSDHGIGSGGTRNISGSTIHHTILEQTIATWHKKESALLFNSAYQANLTTLNTIGKKIPDLVFISDAENHASIIEGIRALPNKKYIFNHNDIHHLKEILHQIPTSTPKLIVFESVYSISGTLAPIAQIIALAKSFGALTYIDEVHAVGIYGESGAGKLEEYQLEAEIDFVNGTLSKAIGCFGGYISASASWIDFIRSFASGFIFTTSLPPSLCIAAHTSISEIKCNTAWRKRFFENVRLLRSSLNEANIEYKGAETHITQIHIGNAIKCKQIADYLLNQAGIYVQPINHPTVPVGEECLRITITPRHSFNQVYNLVHHLKGILSKEIQLIGRSSMLSQVQLTLAKDKINKIFPWIPVNIQYTDTSGDQLTDIPLHTQEGTDFFTDSVSAELISGNADIAVHSLKDLSNHHFFHSNTFAVIDRDEVRDIALFNKDIEDKLKAGIKIRIGTCSFRREQLALEFLRDVLPSFGNRIEIESVPIRGNIDTRLRKLSTQTNYDGIILAFAGINRMFSGNEYKSHFQELLTDKKIMVLPLLECTPAPCQGAIAIESLSGNFKACYILSAIDNKSLHAECIQEKSIAEKYGTGCIQKFGVTSVIKDHKHWIYANGRDQNNQTIDDWYGLDINAFDIAPSSIVHSDNLGFSAIKNETTEAIKINTRAVFISHISAINNHSVHSLENKRIWAAGAKTWKKLAKQNIWVEGCADSFGFESISNLLNSALLNIGNDITILTNTESSVRWAGSNHKAIPTYSIAYQSDLIDKYKLKSARLLFWSCFAHYDHVKDILPSDLIHACLPGKTALLLKSHGHEPILFPTQQSFHQWLKKYTIAHSVA